MILSALADEATTINAVRLGAQDYLIKGEFDAALLVRVMRHARERHDLLLQLERSLAHVRSLLQASAFSGEPGCALVMCDRCKRLRSAPDRWSTLEEYLGSRAKAQLTHETCPDCAGPTGS